MRLLAGMPGSADGVAEQWERSGEHRTRPRTGLIEEKQLSGPEFGPGGYLPPKASKRARKIVLREQMGFGWPLAAIAASVLVLIAGGAYLVTMNRPPAAPFVEMRRLTEVPAGGAATVSGQGDAPAALIVRAGGPVRAFRAQPIEVAWCPESGRLESVDAAWLPNGALVYGDRRESLVPLRTVVHNGVIYVDFDTELPAPAPALQDQPPVCAG